MRGIVGSCDVVMITAKWSTTCCFLERTESTCRVSDTRFDVYQRAPTIDGSSINTRKKSISGPILSNMIDKLCFTISQHLKSVAEDKIIIDRLTLHFKIDSKGMVNFVFCSFIHFTDQTSNPNFTQSKYLFYEPILRNPPNSLDLNLMMTGQPVSLSREFYCVSCERRISRHVLYRDQAKIYEINLKSINRHHVANRLLNEAVNIREMEDKKPGNRIVNLEENLKKYNSPGDQGIDPSQNQNNQNEQVLNKMKKIGNVVPPEIYNAFPNISKHSFNQLQNEVSFQNFVVPVCEECFLYLTSLNEASGSERLKKHFVLKDNPDLKGVGRLKPETIKLRFDDTCERIKEDELGRFNRQRLIKKIEYTEKKVERFMESKGRRFSSPFIWANGDELKKVKAGVGKLKPLEPSKISNVPVKLRNDPMQISEPANPALKSIQKTDRTENSTKITSSFGHYTGIRPAITDRKILKNIMGDYPTKKTSYESSKVLFKDLFKSQGEKRFVTSEQMVGFPKKLGGKFPSARSTSLGPEENSIWSQQYVNITSKSQEKTRLKKGGGARIHSTSNYLGIKSPRA